MMWALPPGWRKWTKRRPTLVAGGAVVAVLMALLVLHVLKDIAAIVLAPREPAPAVLPVALIASAHASASPKPRVAAKPQAPAPHPAADGPFVVRSILSIPGPIHFGQFYWDESKGEPGPLVITVDLTARVLSVFENGHEVGATAILKGYGDKPTPVGVFPITQKDAHHISNIFNVPMPWMLRLTNDGVSIHSSKVERGYATNGCIGVPDGFAEKLFAKARLRDRVIITDGKQLQLGEPIITAPKT